MAFVVTIYKNKEFGYVKKYYCLWLISPEIQDVVDFVLVIVEMFLKKFFSSPFQIKLQLSQSEQNVHNEIQWHFIFFN